MMKKAKAVWKAEAADGAALGTAAHAERDGAFAMFSQPYAAELPAVRADISVKNKLFWAWNGAVEPSEVRRQIADFKQKGFGGFFIHARGGLLVPYMGEAWMQAVEAAVDEAKKQGMEAWLYDEYGWPSGFGGGEVNGKGEKYCQKSLVRNASVNVLARYKRCGKTVPPRKEARYACFAACGYTLCADDEAADITYGYEVNPFYADLFDGDAADAFIACTHEKYKQRLGVEFGRTVKGIFTDEPQYDRPYSEALTAHFAARYGYALEPWLFLLEQDGDAGRVFREDYYGAVCTLFEQNYVRKISHWCRANGLLFTGHFPEEDGVSTQFLKGGDTMLNYVRMDYPGIDFLGRRLISPVPIKQIVSVKNQLDKEHLISETFGCCGWNTALWQYRWLWGYQSALGIDTACMHLAAYSVRGVRKRDYPAFFSYQSSWWSHVRALNDYMERLNEFAGRGKPVNDVLVLSPVSDAYAELPFSDEAGMVSTQFRLLVESFTDLQMQFDVADENYLADVTYKAEKGGLRIGKMRYTVLVVPYMRSIRAYTRQMVLDAQACGVKVVFVSRRPRVRDDVYPADWGDAFDLLPYGAVVQNRTALWEKYFSAAGYTNKAVVVTSADGYRANGLIVRVREDAENMYIAVFNKSVENACGGILRVTGEGTLYRYAVENGKEENTTTGYDGSYTSGTLCVPPGETELFVFRKGKAALGPVYVTEKTERLTADTATLTEENALTLDMAALSTDGEVFGEEKYVLRIQEELHRLASESDCKRRVSVRYRFTVKDLPKKIALCCEHLTADGVACNGTLVTFGEKYIDAQIGRADITPYVRPGENEITVHYTIRPQKQAFDVDTVFESEKNRFAYTAEAESVFLVGVFDVIALGKVRRSPQCYRAENGGFVLAAPKKKNFSQDLTPQGLWFYRGGVRRTFTYEYTGGRCFLSLNGAEGVLTSVSINGVHAGYLSGKQSLEITDALASGKNTIQTELTGSNRNLLGPHHHYLGEQRFVGVNTFRGTRGYEDNVVTVAPPENTFVPSYAFVPLRTGELYVAQKRRSEENL